MEIWRLLFMHWVCLALALAFAKAGNNIAARMAIIAMTTSSSISVNPSWDRCQVAFFGLNGIFMFIVFLYYNQSKGAATNAIPGHLQTPSLLGQCCKRLLY